MNFKFMDCAMAYKCITLIGNEISPYLMQVAALRIEVFREFPYLYDGSIDYELHYLQDYANCPSAILIIALFGDTVIGASTGLPMRDASPAFRDPMREHGYNIDSLFYFAESVVQKAYRGKGLGAYFFQERERFAKSLAGITQSCFCAVDRAIDHPLMPATYRGNDGFWHRLGYQKSAIQAHFSWQDIDQEHETEKSLTFWSKSLNE